MKDTARKGLRLLGNVLKVGLGVGAGLGGAYIFSRIGEKQATETALGRVEQMMEEFSKTEEQRKGGA